MTAQLAFTVGVVIKIMNSEEESFQFLTEPFFLIALLGAYIASLCALQCCNLNRKVPVNYILLGVFTFCVSCLVGVSCKYVDPRVVAEAAVLTFVVTLAVAVYALTLRAEDFTFCCPFCFAMVFIMVTASPFAFLWGVDTNLISAVLGVLLYSIYLICDTILILGGKHWKHKFEKDDYILGALTFYLDIINIFLYILQILTKKKD